MRLLNKDIFVNTMMDNSEFGNSKLRLLEY